MSQLESDIAPNSHWRVAGPRRTLVHLETLQWPSVRARIRQARLQAGLNEIEIARRLGISVEGYGDLEGYDDEAFTVVSLKHVADLGRILGVQSRVLLLGRDGEGVKQTVAFDDVSARLSKRFWKVV